MRNREIGIDALLRPIATFVARIEGRVRKFELSVESHTSDPKAAEEEALGLLLEAFDRMAGHEGQHIVTLDTATPINAQGRIGVDGTIGWLAFPVQEDGMPSNVMSSMEEASVQLWQVAGCLASYVRTRRVRDSEGTS